MSAHCLLYRYCILIIEIIDSLTLNQKWVWNDFNHAPTYILCHNGSWISDGSNIIILNIEGTQTCTSIDDPTRSYYFWLRMNGHQTSTIIGIWLDLMNKQSAQSQTSFFQTSNRLQCVHILVIKLKHSIFGFERSNNKLQTWFDPSLKMDPFYFDIFECNRHTNRGWYLVDEIVIVLASFVFIIGYFGIFDKLLSKLHSAIFITIFYVKTSIYRFAIVYVSEPAEITRFLVTQPILFIMAKWRNNWFHVKNEFQPSL